jgi:hypothetical protein
MCRSSNRVYKRYERISTCLYDAMAWPVWVCCMLAGLSCAVMCQYSAVPVLYSADASNCCTAVTQAAQERKNQLMQVTDVLQSKMASMQSGGGGGSSAVAAK